jgi:hypothetical protein
MNMIKKVILTFYYALCGHPIPRAYEALQKAEKTSARFWAESEYQRIMVGFYTEQLRIIEPHESADRAWEFAAAKQKQHDHTEDWRLECGRYEEAEAIVSACQQRLTELRKPLYNGSEHSS